MKDEAPSSDSVARESLPHPEAVGTSKTGEAEVNPGVRKLVCPLPTAVRARGMRVPGKRQAAGLDHEASLVLCDTPVCAGEAIARAALPHKGIDLPACQVAQPPGERTLDRFSLPCEPRATSRYI